MREIDWPAIDALEEQHTTWRKKTMLSNRAAPLSSVYVPGEGGGDIKALIIGEAPGAQEELKQRPFVGPAGSVLRQLMGFAGLYAAPNTKAGTYPNCWLTNVVKFRPLPRNRTPNEIEITLMRNGLVDEWQAVGKPLLVIPVGGVALRAVMGKWISILRVAGKCHWVTNSEGNQMAIWPMIHPAYALRNPAAQPDLERDWENLAVWRIKHSEGNNFLPARMVRNG